MSPMQNKMSGSLNHAMIDGPAGRAAQEYVEALATNPELQAAGVYDGEAHLLAGFSRGGARLPSAWTTVILPAAACVAGDRACLAARFCACFSR